MRKILLISGSNRKGCTEYILEKIKNSLDADLVCLRNERIDYCKGCLYCHNKFDCTIKDDLFEIINKMIKADLIIFGVPNYFDNVTGLFKNFLDRLHPLYKNEKIKDKKAIFVYVGGGKTDGTEENLWNATKGIVKYLKLNVVAKYSYKCLNINDLTDQQDKIKTMINEIKSLI